MIFNIYDKLLNYIYDHGVYKDDKCDICSVFKTNEK